MRTDPVATVLDSCVGCGVCGANAHAASLCPSFYRSDLVHNPTRRDRVLARLRGGWIGLLSSGVERRAARFEVAEVS
jgi:indolepyruvate ferredoxin oxidoreductase alpha subunit